jgi:hypothetical protein
MLFSIRNAAISAIQRQLHRFFPPPAPQLALAGFTIDDVGCVGTEGCDNSSLEDALWFAVPKRKVSRGKKRMKTTLQKKIKLKDNIVIGEPSSTRSADVFNLVR